LLPLPQKSVLAAQVLEILRAEIAAGRWKGWLPSERTLSDLLKISRPTLRRALKSLEHEKAIKRVHGRGSQILSRSTSTPARREPVTVHLLSPDPLEQLRHYSHLWIAELRFKLFKNGHDFQVHHGVHYLGPGAERSLARLVSQNRDGVWILVHSSRVIQRWFTDHGVPAVITGSRHEGCDLARVVVNMEAVCRHAAGELIRLGHRNIALIRLRTDRAGDLESDQGFLSGAQRADNSVTAHVLHYDEDTPAAIVRTLQRVMRLRNAPTGLLMAHASGYATAATWLSEHGKRIPGDISLICREDDSFLRYLIPRPASYQYSPRLFALKIDSVVQRLITQPDKTVPEIHIIPRYTPGNSVGPPPRAEA
jgi:DNA-binding LacI/PurR family transcriptional regulator/DNA-binding transcriptional regulator YhcF (GntR family)